MIPKNSTEIQKGLYLHKYTSMIGSKMYTFSELYASDGYCFYDKVIEDNYVVNKDTGEITNELKPKNELVYYKYMKLGINMSYWTNEMLNNEFVSVPAEEDFNIV